MFFFFFFAFSQSHVAPTSTTTRKKPGGGLEAGSARVALAVDLVFCAATVVAVCVGAAKLPERRGRK